MDCLNLSIMDFPHWYVIRFVKILPRIKASFYDDDPCNRLDVGHKFFKAFSHVHHLLDT